MDLGDIHRSPLTTGLAAVGAYNTLPTTVPSDTGGWVVFALQLALAIAQMVIGALASDPKR